MGQKSSRRYTEESIEGRPHVQSLEDDSFMEVDPTLNFPFLQDRKTVMYMKGSRVMIILRGLSGSGKSTLGASILSKYKQCCIVCSADDYFIQTDGTYQYERTLLRDAHEHCQKKAVQACKDGVPVVVVDNTNIKLWEMEFYTKLAQQMDYVVVVVEPKTPWKFNINELALKNSHSNDRSVLNMRLNQWEDLKPLFFGWFLNCTDSDILQNIAQVYFESCFEVPEFYDEFQNTTGRSKKKDIMSYFGTNMMIDNGSILHCTSRFCGGPYRSKTEAYTKTKSVQDNYGKVSILHSIGFFITSTTFGARIKLSKRQLNLWEMDDHELKQNASDASSDFLVDSMHRMSLNGAKVKSVSNNHCLQNNSLLNVRKSECSCMATLRTVNQDLSHQFAPSFGRGSRAHITLGCAPNIHPRQTGLDLVAIIKKETETSKSCAVPTFEISFGKLRNYGGGLWAIYPNKELLMETLFLFQ
ncbi:N4BP2L1 (predicted) [Pycnogonum litorale]